MERQGHITNNLRAAVLNISFSTSSIVVKEYFRGRKNVHIRVKVTKGG